MNEWMNEWDLLLLTSFLILTNWDSYKVSHTWQDSWRGSFFNTCIYAVVIFSLFLLTKFLCNVTGISGRREAQVKDVGDSADWSALQVFLLLLHAHVDFYSNGRFITVEFSFLPVRKVSVFQLSFKSLIFSLCLTNTIVLS